MLEAKQFFGNLKLGYSEALASVIADGKGQVSFDLQPESLFLRNLNKVPRKKHRQRYFIFRGRAVRPGQAILLQVSLTAARAGLRRKIENSNNGDLFEKSSLAWIDRLRLPEEIAQGDLAVTLDSAALAGVTQMKTYPLNHTNLPRNPDVMDDVVQILLSESKAN